MGYPKYLSEIRRAPPDGYRPTEEICVVRTGATFRLPGGRLEALVQRWTSPYVGDDPLWVFVPEAQLLGLHPGGTSAAD